jgi:acetyl-CoA carboxylase biotin carboxyl carrier protein
MSQSMLPLDPGLVREFIDLAEQHNLVTLDVTYKDFKLKLSRGVEALPVDAHMAAPPVPQPRPAAPERPVGNAVATHSPLAGIFYRAPRPGAAPFVEVGDMVKVGQTLCIIEAMKLMNEITAETAGRVVKILVENAQVVESGQEIILIEP